MLVRDLLSKHLVAVDADAPIHEIADKMKKQDVGMMPVLNENHVVGVVTDRDLVLRILAPITEPHMMTAWDVMTRNPIMVDDNAPIDRALELMRQNQVRRLVVVGLDSMPVGVISLSDISRYLDKATAVWQALAVKAGPLDCPAIAHR